jgi:hypothetical protein
MKRFALLLATSAFLALSTAGLAAQIQYETSMSGPGEAPPNASVGVGASRMFYDTSAHTLRIIISFSGLTGTTTASHIHCCINPPTAAGVATQTPSFNGFPLGVKAGTFDQTFDLTQASSWNAPFISANGGTPAGAEAALAAGLTNGQAYLNVHSSTFPGGEIRGYLAARGATRTDFNANGKSDILYRNTASGDIYRILMNGFAIEGQAIAYSEPNTAWKVIADADFAGDGVTDLLWRNSTTGQFFLQTFTAAGMPLGGNIFYTEPNAAWRVVGTMDIDGDARSDILLKNSTTGQVYAMLMNGGTITAQGFVYTEPDPYWTIVATGDFAGSGKANQVLWQNTFTGQVYLMTVIFAGNVFAQTGQMIYTEPNTSWKILGAADFDGDGKSDILWRNDATGQVYMMLMNGTAIASQGFVYQEPNLAWKIVAQGDYDGDGKADILWRNDSTGQVYLLKMNGMAVTSQGMVYQEPNTAWRILGPLEYGQQ